MSALRGLLRGIVDYAGLFPPAALDMTTAVRNYASYRADPAAWMLGRFVLPAARLEEFENAFTAIAAEGDAWRLTALLGADLQSDVERIRAFNLRNSGRAVIDSLEGNVASRDEVARFAALGRGFELFAEIALEHDPTLLIAAVQRAGLKAKMRTGGVVASAVPSPESVVRFVRVCLDAGVAFKATAGLHHPLRAEYRLTYDDGAPMALMFGYLNVFLAAAFMAQGMSDADAERVLDERDASAFELEEPHIRWRGRTLSASQVREARERVAVSFGSCSFREPVDELRSLATA